MSKDWPQRFDIRKSIAAVAFLLKKAPNRTMNYNKLLMMLYMADRESLKETGTTITGDQPIALPSTSPR